MMTTKYFMKCKVCGKEINTTNGFAVFNRHLSTHNNPIGRNCNQWYKSYFKRSNHACVCKLCDKEFYHDNLYAWSDFQYINHLKDHHGITQH
ncbi:hypothetical protein [Liquorilactobacillus hordei]|uniref:hypothetical protein n=1 Tax=Liquorilactobacillus hordei TaxID=468911 RepID=UPI0012ECEF15|nr:hypothetical protein [Liquorilactobacillus hordei]QYH51421.1 hypothetical protein G6O70_02500 [Liquorilactobacillus hordei DSM 19519]